MPRAGYQLRGAERADLSSSCHVLRRTWRTSSPTRIPHVVSRSERREHEPPSMLPPLLDRWGGSPSWRQRNLAVGLRLRSAHSCVSPQPTLRPPCRRLVLHGLLLVPRSTAGVTDLRHHASEVLSSDSQPIRKVDEWRDSAFRPPAQLLHPRRAEGVRSAWLSLTPTGTHHAGRNQAAERLVDPRRWWISRQPPPPLAPPPHN